MKNNHSIVLVLLAALTSSCATVEKSIVGEEYENVLPFAQQTVSALGGERIEFRDSEFAYLRQLYDPDAAELANLRRLLSMADQFRNRIIFYSLEVLRIAETQIPDEQRVQEFARTLDSMRQYFSTDPDSADALFDATLANIKSQSDFLAALRAAQPLVNRAGEQFEDHLRVIEEQALVDAVRFLDDAIRSNYAVFLDYAAVMEQRRDELLTGLKLVRSHRRGDDGALAQLRERNIVLNKDIPIPDSPDEQQISRIEEYLLAEMRKELEIAEFTSLDIDAYLKTQGELEREEAEILAALSVARLQIVAWTRAHQAMANGVKDPGKLIEFATRAAMARGLLRR